VKFIIDAQLPPALADWLVKLGSDAQHVEELGLREADYAEIRDFAHQLGAAVITKDRDFSPPGSGIFIVWVRIGNSSNRVLFQKIEAVWPSVLEHFASGVEVVEIR